MIELSVLNIYFYVTQRDTNLQKKKQKPPTFLKIKLKRYMLLKQKKDSKKPPLE